MPRLAHCFNCGIQRYDMRAVAEQRHTCGIDGSIGSHSVAFNAGDLHQPAHRVAGQPKVMFDPYFGSVFHLGRRSAKDCTQAAGSHRRFPPRPGIRLQHRKWMHCA